MIKGARNWMLADDCYFQDQLDRADESRASRWHGKPFKFMVQDVPLRNYTKEEITNVLENKSKRNENQNNTTPSVGKPLAKRPVRS